MASPQRTTQLLWFLAQTLPWLGDLDGIANHQIRRAFLGARHRAFGTVGEAVGCLEYTLGVRPSSSRRMPAPSEAQERVLEALEITPDQYDFYATYETAVGTDLYVFTSGTTVSESCTVSPRIEGGLRRHFHRTGRVSLRSSPNREVADILADSTVIPQLDLCGLDPFAARIYMAVSAIRPGETRSLDWVMRSTQCQDVDFHTLQLRLADHPFPHILPTHRVMGVEGAPILGELTPSNAAMLRRREDIEGVVDLAARGGHYIVRPSAGEYCELSCSKARLGERGAYLITDPEAVCETLQPCGGCQPLHLGEGITRRSA